MRLLLFTLIFSNAAKDVDHLALATLLLKDGHADRAAVVLSQADLKDEGLDKKRYWRLLGLIDMRRARLQAAAGHFQKAIEAGDEDPRLFLLRGQSLLIAGKLKAATEVFETAPTLALKLPQFHLLRAQTLWKTGAHHRAFYALELGWELFENNDAIERTRAFMLIELGLYQEGLAAAERFFERIQGGEMEHLALAEALVGAGQMQPAILFLEAAALRFPESKKIRTQLAATYLKVDRPLAAGEVIRPLAYEDPKVALAAAELYRRARHFLRALGMNAEVIDQKDKTKQRLALLIELRRFEIAATLDARLSRLGLLEDEGTAYALAYAHFKTGNFARVEQLLSKIQDPELFKKSVALRRTIERCAQAVWLCE